MTGIESEQFYQRDNSLYNLNKNSKFLNWYNNLIKNEKYLPRLEIYELQDLIDSIVTWYELKYPERTMREESSNIQDLSEIMNFEQLEYRLNENQKYFLKCSYRAKSFFSVANYDEQMQITDYEVHIGMSIYKNAPSTLDEKCLFNRGVKPYFLISANSETGEVNVHSIFEYLEVNSITLEELLKYFRQNLKKQLDFSELEQTLFLHEKDMELRKLILQLTALKMLYSEKTIPEHGYVRAKLFIEEFNKYILNLNLDTKDIDKIMFTDYKKDNSNISENMDKKRKILRTLIAFFTSTVKPVGVLQDEYSKNSEKPDNVLSRSKL